MYFVIIVKSLLNRYIFHIFFIEHQPFEKLVTFYLELDIETIITKLRIWQAKLKVNRSIPEKKHKFIKFMQSFNIILDFPIFLNYLKYYVHTISFCMKILKICPTETQ